MRLRKAVFWGSAGLIWYTQIGYPLALSVLDRVRARRTPPSPPVGGGEPRVTLVVAAHREGDVIAGKIANARALDWPQDRLELIVACDGSPDDTPARAREAGADQVLELPRGGKVRAQDAAVRAADPRSEVIAFSDANAEWEPGALRELVAALAQPGVGYACGQVRFVSGDGSTNQEGVYWRYEMAIRECESSLASVTAGNGAIYAVRREDYAEVDPVMGHDLSFPFGLVKRGRRAVYAPSARASERMVPTTDGEIARKRRMMSHSWATVLRGGMLDPRGYPPLYAWMILSHRVLRYGAPALHAACLAANAALWRSGTLYRVALVKQAALIAGALLGGRVESRPLLILRYYAGTNLAVALGLWDHLRHGTEAGWSPPAGTR